MWLAAPPDPVAAASPHFVVCHYGKPNAACVVDGDTWWWNGEKFRAEGYDSPELGPPNCPGPARGAVAARDRVLQLLNAGNWSLARHGHDRYGRTLARVTIGGVDLGAILIREGLARVYVRGERPWC